MNLSDARVDLFGQIVAFGRLTFAADCHGHFPATDHDCLRFDPRLEQIRLAAATSLRDPSSGFLIATEVLPVVILPGALSLLIKDALENLSSGSVTASIEKEDGRLDSTISPGTSWKQPLSDWRFKVVSNKAGLEFTISAALLATNPINRWQSRTGNCWNDSCGIGVRLHIVFCVDNVTRVALFGTRLPGQEEQSTADCLDVRKTTASDIRLADALVGRDGNIFGHSPFDHLVRVSDSGFGRKSVSIQRRSSKRRLCNGFISSLVSYDLPMIKLIGVDMNIITDAVLGNGSHGTIDLSDGFFGSLWGSHQDDNPMISVGNVFINLRLTVFGLKLSYNLERLKAQSPWQPSSDEVPWQGSLVIPWEVLILRYPKMGYRRLDVLEKALA